MGDNMINIRDVLEDADLVWRIRHCASEWHGGQWSPFYALSSSGTITLGLRREANSCLDHAEREEDIELLEEIAKLEDYLPQEEDEE